MDQEKIGNFIKEIRKKEGLTQKEFAQKYGVTYQAVSKWELGKNIPDISILKQMCEEYHVNLNDFLNGEADEVCKKTYPWKKNVLLVSIAFLLIFLFSLMKQSNDFHTKSLTTTCDNFKLYGTLVYNDNKTSIIISNLSYCGDENKEYRNLKCTLYELNGDIKKELQSVTKQDQVMTLEEFVSDIDFTFNHYDKNCKMYEENALQLEIEAEELNGHVDYYKIPIKSNDVCVPFK